MSDRPAKNEYPERYAHEIEPVPYEHIIEGFQHSMQQCLDVLNQISDDKLLYVYAEGKWTIKEIWQHVIDTERIICSRALRFARKESKILNGFNENEYASVSNANQRNWKELLNEYQILRQSTIALYNSFDSSMMLHQGTAGQSTSSVRALGYLLVGHEMHHLGVIRERYLVGG